VTPEGRSDPGERHLSARVRKVSEYIAELEKTLAGRTEQVREGLEIYIELWKKAVDNGVISMDDGVEFALSKIEAKGGLYRAAETDGPQES
jgi:hypothetical protein